MKKEGGKGWWVMVDVICIKMGGWRVLYVLIRRLSGWEYIDLLTPASGLLVW